MSSVQKLISKYQVKQRITPDLKIDNSTPLNPPTHQTENLICVQGAGYQYNAKQNIVDKKDINSY